MNICYLGTCSNKDKPRIFRQLAEWEAVVRITDHDEHIKVISTGPLPEIEGWNRIKVRDKTEHWDVKYWDFAMTIFRYMLKKHQNPVIAIDVLVHYLCNLSLMPESAYLNMLSANRRWIDLTVSDEEDHGWELEALKKKWHK